MATNSKHLVSFQRLCAHQHEHMPSNFKMEDVIFHRRPGLGNDGNCTETWCRDQEALCETG